MYICSILLDYLSKIPTSVRFGKILTKTLFKNSKTVRIYIVILPFSKSKTMNDKQLVGKIAADKESKKLGKIIRVENLPLKTIKKQVPHVIISYERFLRRSISIALEGSKLLRTEGNYTWFDVLKKNFLKEVDRQRIIIEEREQYDDFVVPSTSWYTSRSRIYDRRPRPRKKRKL